MSDKSGYDKDVDIIRDSQYPMLDGATYLDHSGTTLYAKSLIERFATSMITGLYGNPHSSSASSILTTKRIDDVRLRALQFFKADPEEFDLVFVANTTAAVKLVAEGFRSEDGFHYLYHQDSHTSIVGVREIAKESHCFDDEAVGKWINQKPCDLPNLLAYPAQSNMTGRKLPLSWTGEIRRRNKAYTLLDAAALVSTSQLDLSDSENAPDFTCLSFYKIFGFPDLGALIVRKDSSHILTRRPYFGGGTVEMVSCQDQWHASKESIHEQLEDGTLPIHNIIALDSAFDVHQELYGSMEKISNHTSYLAEKLYRELSLLRNDGQPVCTIYSENPALGSQGPVIAFNIRNSDGTWVSNSEVEKLASIRNIHLRTGNLCNPGGIAYHLNLESYEMKQNFAAGQRCSNDNEGLGGKPTGVIRVSLGAMSNMKDVNTFIDFIKEFYTTKVDEHHTIPSIKSDLYVESLMIYPIKSCAGWSVPDIPWEVKSEGLIWDREWCLIHTGTGQALSQKRYPRMALIKPEIDLRAGLLRIRYHDHQISVSLEESDTKTRSSNVCSEKVNAYPYNSEYITEFFTNSLGVPCNLARFPPGGSGPSIRHSKAHLQQHQLQKKRKLETPPPSPPQDTPRPILLSNESPILCITRPSLDFLNSKIRQNHGRAADAAVFRSNIIIGSSTPTTSMPYAEDSWKNLKIGKEMFEMLGSCRRCAMICVDQETAERNEEPFVTLVKTRRYDNKVFFGEHMCHVSDGSKAFIRVGDTVEAFVR